MEEILLKINIAKAIYIICAFVPIVIFAVKYKMQRSETVGFVIGLAANLGTFFACAFPVIISVASRLPVLEIICTIAVFVIPILLYRSILYKYISEAKIAESFSLGLSQASTLFCILVVNLSVNDFIFSVQEGHYEGQNFAGHIYGINDLFFGLIIMAAVKIVLIVLSAFAVKKIYLSKDMLLKGKAVLSSIIMFLCGVGADLVLIAVT